MADAYWKEIMPDSDVTKDPSRRQTYFETRFFAVDCGRHVRQAVVNGRPIGFAAYTVINDQRYASIDDFYIVPASRRQGYGADLLQTLYREFDKLGVERVDLTVRRDTLKALAFWESQGFRIALFQLRQYRDPNTGTAFIGALSSDFSE